MQVITRKIASLIILLEIFKNNKKEEKKKEIDFPITYLNIYCTACQRKKEERQVKKIKTN